MAVTSEATRISERLIQSWKMAKDLLRKGNYFSLYVSERNMKKKIVHADPSQILQSNFMLEKKQLSFNQ